MKTSCVACKLKLSSTLVYGAHRTWTTATPKSTKSARPSIQGLLSDCGESRLMCRLYAPVYSGKRNLCSCRHASLPSAMGGHRHPKSKPRYSFSILPVSLLISLLLSSAVAARRTPNGAISSNRTRYVPEVGTTQFHAMTRPLTAFQSHKAVYLAMNSYHQVRPARVHPSAS